MWCVAELDEEYIARMEDVLSRSGIRGQGQMLHRNVDFPGRAVQSRDFTTPRGVEQPVRRDANQSGLAPGVDSEENLLVPAAGMPNPRKPRRLGQPVLCVSIRKMQSWASPQSLKVNILIGSQSPHPNVAKTDVRMGHPEVASWSASVGCRRWCRRAGRGACGFSRMRHCRPGALRSRARARIARR